MHVKLLTEHHLEFLSLKGGCTGLSESTLVKMPHSWKSCVTDHNYVDDTSRQRDEISSFFNLGSDATKPVFGVSDTSLLSYRN